MRRQIRWIDVWAVGTGALVLGGFVFVCLLAWTLTAHGQSTAASQPLAAGGAATWLKAHSTCILGIAVVVLPALITALARYPRAKGLVAVLQVACDVLSILTHKDSPGTVKLPLTRSQPPVEK